jgi:hypothetical protein
MARTLNVLVTLARARSGVPEPLPPVAGVSLVRLVADGTVSDNIASPIQRNGAMTPSS